MSHRPQDLGSTSGPPPVAFLGNGTEKIQKNLTKIHELYTKQSKEKEQMESRLEACYQDLEEQKALTNFFETQCGILNETVESLQKQLWEKRSNNMSQNSELLSLQQKLKKSEDSFQILYLKHHKLRQCVKNNLKHLQTLEESLPGVTNSPTTISASFEVMCKNHTISFQRLELSRQDLLNKANSNFKLVMEIMKTMHIPQQNKKQAKQFCGKSVSSGKLTLVHRKIKKCTYKPRKTFVSKLSKNLKKRVEHIQRSKISENSSASTSILEVVTLNQNTTETVDENLTQTLLPASDDPPAGGFSCSEQVLNNKENPNSITCDEDTDLQYEMWRHLEVMPTCQTDDHSTMCEICGEICQTKKGLRLHKATFHLSNRNAELALPNAANLNTENNDSGSVNINTVAIPCPNAETLNNERESSTGVDMGLVKNLVANLRHHNPQVCTPITKRNVIHQSKFECNSAPSHDAYIKQGRITTKLQKPRKRQNGLEPNQTVFKVNKSNRSGNATNKSLTPQRRRSQAAPVDNQQPSPTPISRNPCLPPNSITIKSEGEYNFRKHGKEYANSNSNQFVCRCGKHFHTRSTFLRHLKLPNVACKVCDKRFLYEHTLVIHLRTYHNIGL